MTSILNVAAGEIADMYKSRWAIESSFRWIKQNLNVPVLFGTTENAVFNQLFAGVIASVLLKWLHVKGGKQSTCKPLSFAGFQRLLLCDDLHIKWRIRMELTTAIWPLCNLSINSPLKNLTKASVSIMAPLIFERRTGN
ncbi:transposase [Paenisporosarcina sp. TG20]|uniref:transposase n=1 Tax=Paenisporosarcina sp. TG20 TaxID=1211706 RepID=UPI00037B87F3